MGTAAGKSGKASLTPIKALACFLLGMVIAAPAMGAVTFEAATQAFGQINGSERTITIPIPGGTSAGDVLIASMSVRWFQATVTPPTGWNVASQLIEDTPQSNGAGTCSSGTTAGIRTLTFYKVATGTETAPVFTYSSSCNDSGFAAAGMLRFSGVDTANPIVASAESTTNNSTSHTAPSVNSGTETNTMLVTVHSYGSSRSWSTSPPGMTERVDQRSYNNDNALGTTLGVFTQSIAAAGATGTRTATGAGDADNGATHSILIRASGGGGSGGCVESLVGSDTLVTCTGNGTFTPPTGVTNVRYLVVGGGGGGGGLPSGGNLGGGGGGGAGGVLRGNTLAVVPGTDYTISVGAGGAAGVGGSSLGGTGGSSSIGSLVTANGGGGGASNGVSNNGADGASGGGGRINGSGGTGIAGQGFAGGNGSTSGGSGGGGGASAAGGNGSGTSAGSGGAGISDDITGVAVAYGQGGDGGAYAGTRANGVNATPNTGNGGEGATGNNGGPAVIGGTGGSGIVILRYSTSAPPGCQPITPGSTTTNAANASSLTLDVPSGISAGDVLVAQVAIRPICLLGLCGGITAPAGWTLIQEDTNPTLLLSRGTVQGSYYRVADGSEPASYAWTFGSSRAAGGIGAYRGVDPDAPIDAHSGQTGSSATLTAPSVTTTTEGALLLGLFTSGHGNTNVTPSSPLGTVYQARTGAGGNGVAVGAGSEILGAAGATGVRTATAGDNNYVTRSIALRAAPCGPSGPDHIRLLHDGSALTCQAEAVTVRACADETCSTLYSGAVTVDLTAPAAGWTPDPVTFSGGEAVVQLSRTTAGTVTLNAEATSPAATNATQCVNSGGGNACELTFADVGVLIDGDDSDGTLASDVPTQLAGKPSNVGFNGATQRVRVVRTDTQTGACVAGLEDQTLDATFSYSVPIANDGLSNNTIAVSGASSQTLTAAGSGEAVQLAFDGNGTAPFTFTAQDAGRYQLRVAMNIPVTDANGDATGETIAASNTSNAFVVRPLAVFADAAANPKAQDADGSAYKKAGEAFVLTFKSLRWAAGRDDDGDGQWDGCGTTTLADPGTYARVPAWTLGQPAADLALPAGGTNSGLAYANGNVAFTAAATDVSASGVSYGEIGIVQLAPAGLNSFLGAAVEVCSPYIGRFIPDHFDVSHTATPACNATFTYAGLAAPGSKAGQPFAVSGTVTARNAAGTETENYEGDFAKLGTGDISASPRQGTGAAAGTLSWSVDSLGFADGVGTFAVGAARYAFNAEGAPQSIHLRVTATDSDGVTGTEDDTTKVQAYRVGRLRLQNAFGSELMALEVPLHAETFTTGGFYAQEANDGCTALTLATHLQLSDDNGTTWSNGDQTMAVGAGTTTATPLFSPLVGGDAGLSFGAPGAGNTGNIDILTAIGASHPWLLFDWDGNGVHNNEATGRATFGIYKGSPRHIYLRERY